MRKVDAGARIGSLQFAPDGDLLFGAVGDFMQAWDLDSLPPTPLWRTRGFARLAHVTADGALVTREEGEIHPTRAGGAARLAASARRPARGVTRPPSLKAPSTSQTPAPGGKAAYSGYARPPGCSTAFHLGCECY